MTSRRRLIVMRHGKSEPFGASDHERALTERGARSAADAGRHLAQTGSAPDYAVVSSAVRTQQTWDACAETSGSHAEVSVDEAVFSGSADVVLEALRAVPEGTEVLVFVGHNPSAACLAAQLDDGDGDAEAISAMLQGFPSGALVTFEVEVPWAELATETGRVVDFYIGQG